MRIQRGRRVLLRWRSRRHGRADEAPVYAGDDREANKIAAQLAAQIGFEPLYLGPLKESRLLEPLAMAWIVLARHRGLGRDFALNIVRRG